MIWSNLTTSGILTTPEEEEVADLSSVQCPVKPVALSTHSAWVVIPVLRAFPLLHARRWTSKEHVQVAVLSFLLGLSGESVRLTPLV